jgi:predicted SAM-dependent methyltransferase
MAHDLKRGIPFADETFDAVYHSHVLEHFSAKDAPVFLAECFRVLKPGSIIRAVVPDLENIATLYLHALGEALRGEKRWQHNYEWVMLELYDQAVRESPGGRMMNYLRRQEKPTLEFVLERGGTEVREIIKNAQLESGRNQASRSRRSSFALILRGLHRFLSRSGFGREALLRLMLGPEYNALRLGRFRLGGEPHLWMYDRYSLVKILREAGFSHPQLLGPKESRIPNWTQYNLDTEPDGTIYKPYSLYAEALK